MFLVTEDDNFGDFIQVPTPTTTIPNSVQRVTNDTSETNVSTNKNTKVTTNKGSW